jgi:hypothetical protein
MFDLDPYVLVEVTKSFANHIDVLKKVLRFMLSLLNTLLRCLKLSSRLSSVLHSSILYTS